MHQRILAGGLGLLLALAPAVHSEIMAPEEFNSVIEGLDPGDDDGGAGGDSSLEFATFVSEQVDGLNTSDEEETEETVTTIAEAARENATTIHDELALAGNYSKRVIAAVESADTNLTLTSQRTNVSRAYGPTRLSDAISDLHDEVGDPLTTEEELSIVNQAQSLPDAVRTAGAVAIYAAIDAAHYAYEATAEVEPSNASTVLKEGHLLSMLHRRMEFSTAGENTTVTYAPNTTEALMAAGNLSHAIDEGAFFKAGHVLAKALDEVNGLDLPVTDLPGQRDADGCTNGDPVVLASPDCTVILGGTDREEYLEMAFRTGPFNSGPKFEKNAVLIDFGGNDVYNHRAGGGLGDQTNNPCPKCKWPVQVNIDLGAGDDAYPRLTTPRVPRGPVQGAGQFGVGLLYDAGGNDRYEAKSAGEDHGDGIVSQGAARSGAGMLFDAGGDDIYVTHQPSELAVSSAQGATEGEGLAIAWDKDGRDRRFFNVTGDHENGGGAQGFARSGIAYLVDEGADEDSYVGEQDYVQAAATQAGFAFLEDDGGANTFRITSSDGCAHLRDDECARSLDAYRPTAGWSQGYADNRGYAVLHPGPGPDRFEIQRMSTAESRLDEGRSILGHGNLTGTGILVEPGGDDHYGAKNASQGTSSGGVGLFLDVTGRDTYGCPMIDTDLTCYGLGEGGYGIFQDPGASSDEYTAWDDRGDVWVLGDLGLGVR